MSTLRDQASKYIQERGIPFIAEKLGKKASTVRMWTKSGNYPLDLIELMQGTDEPSPPQDVPSAIDEKRGHREWTPEALDELEAAVVTYGEKLRELNLRLIDLEERHNPKPIMPQKPSATVPPAIQDDNGFVAANSVRPGPIAPTPVMIRGEPPPAMLPPPQMVNPHPQNRYSNWLEPFVPRERRY